MLQMRNNGGARVDRIRRRQTALAAIVMMAALLPVGPAHVGAAPAVPQGVPVGDPVIVAAGDIACDPADARFNGGQGTAVACQQSKTADLITNLNPAAVLPLGDNQYECGGLQAFQQSYDLSWGQHLAKTYPVVGNHEYIAATVPPTGTDCSPTQSAAGYFTYYAGAAEVGTTGQGWYSYDIGNWHLIALNSQCGQAGGCSAPSPQGQWLAADLLANTKPCTLAYWHIPTWSSGGRANPATIPLVQQLVNAKADVLLTGHDHIYERFALQNATGVLDADGIREFVVGTGGAEHTEIALVATNSEVRDVTSFGVLKMTLHADSYDWNFVPVAGQTFTDSGTTTCHNKPRTTNTLSGWLSAGGTLKGSPAIAPIGSGNSFVFARGADDAVWSGVLTDQFQGWVSMGGITGGPPAASSRGTNKADLFAVGADQAVWWRSWDGATWTDWTSLGGLALDGPAAVSRDGNSIDLFARGLDDQLWQKTFTSGTWGDWTPLGGILTSSPAAASTGAGIDVAARGGDGAAWVRTFDGSWSPWTFVGGLLLDQPALAARADNELNLFATGLDQVLWNRVRDVNGWTGPFVQLSGVLSAGPGAALTSPGTITVVANGADSALWFTRAT